MHLVTSWHKSKAMSCSESTKVTSKLTSYEVMLKFVVSLWKMGQYLGARPWKLSLVGEILSIKKKVLFSMNNEDNGSTL